MSIVKDASRAVPETIASPNSPPAPAQSVSANVSDGARAQAERLVEQLGSVELARHAVDLAQQAVEAVAEHGGATNVESVLHKHLGFATQQDLLHASCVLESNDGNKWYITHLADDSWVAWNEADHKCDRHFMTAEEALASVPHEAEFTGSSLLG